MHLTKPHSAAKFLSTSAKHSIIKFEREKQTFDMFKFSKQDPKLENVSTVNVICNQKPLKTNTDLLGSQNENINNQ